MENKQKAKAQDDDSESECSDGKEHVTDEEDEELFRIPPRDDCQVCFLPLPEGRTQYQACCGKEICGGCMHSVHANASELIPCPCGNPNCKAKRRTSSLCPFCRTEASSTEQETVKRLRKRMALNDPIAISVLGTFYAYGQGVPRNVPKAIELWEQAAELGSTEAHAYLGDAYNTKFDNGRGMEQSARDWKTAVRYYERAAKGGHEQARFNLAALHNDAGNEELARKHWMIVAKMGNDMGLMVVKEGYTKGEYTKDEFASALRAHKESNDELQSGHRKNVHAENNLWVSGGT